MEPANSARRRSRAIEDIRDIRDIRDSIRDSIRDNIDDIIIDDIILDDDLLFVIVEDCGGGRAWKWMRQQRPGHDARVVHDRGREQSARNEHARFEAVCERQQQSSFHCVDTTGSLWPYADRCVT